MNNSSMNTVILILILGLIAFGIVWFFKNNQPENDAGLNVELNIPTQDNNDRESN